MQSSDSTASLARVALLGNHLPRHCGIATFTTDLANAFASEFPDVHCSVLAMNDPGRQYAYPQRVTFELVEKDPKSYRRATDFLNVNAIDVLCVQHEYGIFGGRAGSHILSVLGEVRMPVVTTLHTILTDPSADQRRVMDEITRLSARLVVMGRRGRQLLHEVHGVPLEKIDVIPHGIPMLPDRKASRRRLGVEGTTQLLTFGLLSPDKGLEYVIDAMPAVLARHPNAVYVIVGATHPNVKEWHGEECRRGLQLRAQRLGVERHVVFHDRFVSASELAEFLAAADIYLTPYLNPEQSTSGTLAYAVGNGKVVVSTDYAYARELLAGERGALVPMRDAGAISSTLIRLLDAPEEQEAFELRAAEVGQDMRWPSVARQYFSTFERAHAAIAPSNRAFFDIAASRGSPLELPELSLRHLATLTDDTGLLQHAAFTVPRYGDGYCLDDNARGLLLTATIEDIGTELEQQLRVFACRYLAFIQHAFNTEVGRFRNFMSYCRRWDEHCGSEDSHGRAIWALGAVVGRAREPGRMSVASQLFHAALPAVVELNSPRALAFAVLGIHEYSKAFNGDRIVGRVLETIAQRLWRQFEEVGTADWPWCEDILSYENARLPQALIVAGTDLGLDAMVETGLTALKWLTEVQRSEAGYFSPIGSNGFFPKQGERAAFDEQPVEACATVSACLDAWRVTPDDQQWDREMWRAVGWFLGENQLRLSLYDPTSGGCRDGLHADRTNENQGAESTLSMLLALADMAALDSERRVRQGSAPLRGQVS